MELLLWLSMGRPGNKLLWKTDLPNGDHCMATCGAMSCPQALLARVLSPLHQRPPCYYQMKVAKSDQWLSAYCKLALMPVLNLSPPPFCLSYRWENWGLERAPHQQVKLCDLICCAAFPCLPWPRLPVTGHENLQQLDRRLAEVLSGTSLPDNGDPPGMRGGAVPWTLYTFPIPLGRR